MALEIEDKLIAVRSTNVSLGDRLPDYARESIPKVASKVFG